nr:PKD domain-containing protein [uncultured Desulfobacter sp.]
MKAFYIKISSSVAVSSVLAIFIFGFTDAVLAQTIDVTVTTAVISSQNQATFTATEAGNAKAHVNIYIDGILSDETDSNGKCVVSGLTSGSHTWEAIYGGGAIGIGKFVFFQYGILATGTDSPPINFSYAINVTASTSGIWGYDAWTSGEYKQAFIDTPGIASGTYLKCKRREIRADIHYGISFDSPPSINISSTGYDGANPHIGGSPWCSMIEERTDGCSLKSFVYYVGYTILGSSVKKWLPSDNAQFSITWSGSKAGSNSVNKNDTDKIIETMSGNRTNGTSLALTVNGTTYHGEYSVQGGGVKLWFVGNELHAAYIASPQSWSQTSAGSGSVTDKDVGRLITESSLESPNNDTAYSIEYLLINGTSVRDQDDNDKNRDLNKIEYSGVMGWMSGNKLYASMSYHPPSAFIDSISPILTQIDDSVYFNGHGTDTDPGDYITEYKWRSHKDGVLSTSSSFATDKLSAGSHVIYFQVADSTPYTKPFTPLWSPEITSSIRVNKPPVSYISLIRGTGIDSNGYPTLILGEPMTFDGVGLDFDGYISGYEWNSNISGLLSTSKSFTISDLPIGVHKISLRVWDNEGAWSEVSREIKVRRTPVVFVGGYDWEDMPKYGEIHYRPEIEDPKATTRDSNLFIQPRTGDLYKWAYKLSEEISKLKLDTGTKKVDIVAYSAGGLIARWYIQKGYRNDVRKFISEASPHHGTDVSLLGQIFLEPWEGEKGGGRSIRPHSDFLRELNGHDGCADTRERGIDLINPNTEYYVIAQDSEYYRTFAHTHNKGLEKILGGNITFPALLRIGDGVVLGYSAYLDNVVWFKINEGDHPGYYEELGVIAKANEILHNDSFANMVQDSTSSFENPLEPTQDSQKATHQIETINDTIQPSGIASHVAQIDATADSIIFELQGRCALDLTVTSPSGARIDSSDPDISVIKQDDYILYEIANPEVGNWTLEVTEPGISTNECSYAIRIFMETKLFVGTGTDQNGYKPNDTIKVYAYVQYDDFLPETTSVTAHILKPDASSETILLFDDGAHGDMEASDNIYRGTYDNTTLSGDYLITVNAVISQEGKTYNRTARTATWVELYPDLAISPSDIAFSNTNPNHGAPVTITATIKNIGDIDANEVKILFFDGDPEESGISIGEKTIDLPAGETTTVSIPWQAVRGTHTIHIIISPFNEFLEQTYDNNRASADITVNDSIRPVPNAGADMVVLVDTPVLFDGSASTDNAGIVNYAWDINTSIDSDGDGIADNDVDLTGAKPVYVGGYLSPGTYEVKLSVNDADGNGPVSDILIVTVTSESDIQKPVASAGSDQTVRLMAAVSFDASQSHDDFGIASYSWDTDVLVDSDQDGIPDNDIDLIGVRPSLTNGYSTSGPHTVKLTVDDVAGNGPVSDTLTVTVTNSPPIARAGGPYNADEGSLVMLDGGNSEDPDGDQLKYRWDFNGDGVWDTQWSAVSTAHHAWADDYSGIVNLEVSDGDFNAIATAQIIINNLAPIVEAGANRKVNAGDVISFSGLITDPGESDIHTIEWDFGDGTTVGGDLGVSHQYNKIGEYQIILTVTDDDGGTGQDTLQVSVVPKTSPEVSTDTAADVTSDSVILRGTLVNTGATTPVQVKFKWGFDTSYGHETSSQTMTGEGAFIFYLTGLSSNTTYHFRAKAVGDGTGYGEDMSFTTPAPPPATTVWVDDDYAQNNAGGHDWGYDAFNRIQDGIEAVASPGSVHVAAGWYNENLSMKSGVEILGTGPEVSIIDGSGNGSVMTADNVTRAKIDGFTLTNGISTSGGGIYITNSGLVISNCIISDNSADDGGGIFMSNSSADITDCIICDNTAFQSGGIECTDGSSPTISGCTIKGNHAGNLAGGMRCYRSALPILKNCIITANQAPVGSGIVCQDYAEPTFINCTITGNQSDNYGGGIICQGYPSWPIITNCILWDNTLPEVSSGIENISYSNIDQDGFEDINGNIRKEPLFVGGEDYHLSADSPCIDAGTLKGAPIDDIDGEERPFGVGIDIGADEYVFSSLVLFFDFENGSTVSDSSGNGNDGTVNGAVFSPGEGVDDSNAFLFDWSAQNNIEVAYQEDQTTTEELTIEAWIYPTDWDNVYSGYNRIVSKPPVYLLGARTNGLPHFQILTENNGYQDVTNFNAMSLNQWHYVVGTFDGRNLNIYLDGKLGGTTELIENDRIVANENPIFIAESPELNEGFSGVIDNVAIYKSVKPLSKIEKTWASIMLRCQGDFDNDCDVDGSDLTVFAVGGSSITAKQFAVDFGRMNCP